MLASLLMLAQAAAAPLPMPAFMTGCWIMRSGNRTAEECWTRGNAGLMIGSGRAWSGETIDNWEWMRIERGADGHLSFFASPKGAPQTGFKAVKISAEEVVFENPAHDYPQRVRYWKTTNGIAAEIAKADGSNPIRYDFEPMAGPKKP
jgi:Domain of unknown function (DUF6265)